MPPHEPPPESPQEPPQDSNPPHPPGRTPRPSPLDSTADLIARIRMGDEDARNALFARIHKPLHRFAHGRLPARARDLTDTEDLVQSAMIRALDHVDEFDSRHEGSFMAYMRTAVLNRIRDEARRSNRRGDHDPMTVEPPTPDPSPLEMAVGREALERYEQALDKLPPDQRQAVILRVELGYTYAEIAQATNLVSTDAARMMVTRAIAKLARTMRPHDPHGA